MRISIVAPVLDEVDFIGLSIMSFLDHVHEFVYALDEKSKDGTRELLQHIKSKYAHEKLVVLEHPTFHPHNQEAYNAAFDRCIQNSTGDVVAFIHPDMICTHSQDLREGPIAWWTNITSYAGDGTTLIAKGRCNKWKNIHVKRFGLVYRGAYGSQNEDFYHSDITGKSLKHFGEEFSKYPYVVADSGIRINHYCEAKGYRRRLEKMKLCLKTLYPAIPDDRIEEMAVQHPRVSLEQSSQMFGEFKFEQSTEIVPPVFEKYSDEFKSFAKGALVHA